MMMGTASKQEILTITDTSLTNTSNIDAYFGALIDGWSTENIVIALKNPHSNDNNRLFACWSKYSLDVLKIIDVYRINGSSVTRITRSDWAVNVAAGDEYIVTRLGTMQ